jgi:protein TonB
LFAALPEERIYLAPAKRPGEARRRAIAVTVVLATYTLAGATLVYDGGFGQAPKPAEEIPVEIIVEPPPPPPPPPTPSPEAQAPHPPLDLSPAYDAPRAGTADTDNGDKEKDSKPPPAPAAEDKSAERASGAEAKAEAPKPEASATPEPAPEVQPPAPAPPLKLSEGEVPPPAPPHPEPQATPSPTPQPQTSQAPSPAPAAPAAGKSAPLFASVPDIDFGGAAMKAPVAGGNAGAGYYNILYGEIMPHFHPPRGGRAALGRGYGVVIFTLDAKGRLLNRYIAEESGLPELDRAAIDAIGAASPFSPPPPGIANRGIRFRYDLR